MANSHAINTVRSQLTWLHLSDWHQRGKDFERKIVRDALIEDLKNRTSIDSSLANIDFVVFSGDASFSGLPEEFESARENLFDPVLESIGLSPEALFIVPGNHDLSREIIYEMLPPELQKPLDSDAKVQKWLTDQNGSPGRWILSNRTPNLSLITPSKVIPHSRVLPGAP